jgi:DNA mismatch endonuclease (patch repair protein)
MRPSLVHSRARNRHNLCCPINWGWNETVPHKSSMHSNKATESGPERRLRNLLWQSNIRGYRKNYRQLPGTPDIVFVGKRVAIFVHGCFWHQCPTCSRNLAPSSNRSFWQEKFQRNKQRDSQKARQLRLLGFRVKTVWECQIKSRPNRIVKEIAALLGT